LAVILVLVVGGGLSKRMLEGAFLQIDHKSNVAFYGKEGVARGDIFRNKGIEVPGPAKEFKEVLGTYTTAKNR